MTTPVQVLRSAATAVFRAIPPGVLVAAARLGARLPGLRRLPWSTVERAAHARRRPELIRATLAAPVDPALVFLESYRGTGVTCNPEAVFRRLLADERFTDLRFVWDVADKDGSSPVLRELAAHPRVSFVEHQSPEYFEALHRARYVVANATLSDQYVKRAEQTYLNTWHGTPLKAMGYDIPRTEEDFEVGRSNFLKADYLLSTCPMMTSVMYGRAYRLAGAYEGTVLEVGSPRVDTQFDAATPARVRGRLAAAGVRLGEGPVVVVAPTWRGTSVGRADRNLDELHAVREHLAAALGDLGATVLLRVHQFVYAAALRDPRLAGSLVPLEIGANELLTVADVLVTDYSSVFFDYLPLDRPICFYASDLREYTAQRGLYMPIDTWPGPLAEEVEALATDVRAAVASDPYAERRRQWRATYAGREDGGAAQRVVDIVFGGSVPAPGDVGTV